MNVGELLALTAETREKLAKADDLIERLSRGKPAVLGQLVEPTLRIKDNLESDLAELEKLASDAGL